MPTRRLLRVLLAAAVITPAGLFARQVWRDSGACEREFDTDSTAYEICREYGVPAACGSLDNSPFSCSDDAIGGREQLIAARNAGIFRTRLECATHHQVSAGPRCSPPQWDAWCATRHGGPKPLARCRATGPEGPEGAPPREAEATVSEPVGPLSGPPTGCGTLTTYQLPEPGLAFTGSPLGNRPGAVTVDPDGSVWFTESVSGSISHMTVDGKITRRPLPTQPGALVRDPAGNLWFTDSATDVLWKLSPDGGLRRLAIPAATTPFPGAPGPPDLTVGPDGTVWFIDAAGDRIGRVNPDLTITEVSLSGAGDGHIRPSSISAGPDGSIWVGLSLGRRVARVDGKSLRVTQFPVGPSGSGVPWASSVAAGDDGGLWFEKPNASLMQAPTEAALVHLDSGGRTTYHPLPGPSRWPGSLTAGPDGAIWFLDGPAGTVGRMAGDGTLTEFPFAEQMTGGGTSPGQLAAGSDRLWFAQPGSNRLGLITCG